MRGKPAPTMTRMSGIPNPARQHFGDNHRHQPDRGDGGESAPRSPSVVNAARFRGGRASTDLGDNGCVTAVTIGGTPVQAGVALMFAFKKISKKGDGMVRHDPGLPHENSCAQCGKPIGAPDWTENGPRRISYLWHCRACNYEFEAVAFYDASHPSQEALDAYAAAA
jgi:hypothetical protein